MIPTTSDGLHEDPRVGAAYDHCRDITREHAKTFYFASMFLPPRKRHACFAIYAFCRSVDDISDEEHAHDDERDVAVLTRRLAHWRSTIDDIFDGGTQPDPIALALQDAIRRFGIRREHFHTLIDGVLSDLDFRFITTFPELEDYCYKVASVVGLMTARIFGYSEQAASQHARDLGTAMQLTNILRDVGEDADRGRIYLPLAELDQFGVTREEIFTKTMTSRFVALMRFSIQRAREFYQRADLGIPLLDVDSRMTVRLMSKNYRRILVRIEENGYDVFHRRASLSFLSKVSSIPAIYLQNTWEKNFRP